MAKVDAWAEKWWWCHEYEVAEVLGEVVLDGLDIKFGGGRDIEGDGLVAVGFSCLVM